MDSRWVLLPILLVILAFVVFNRSSFQNDHLLFIHIPKTAGSMIETQFEKYNYKVGKNGVYPRSDQVKCNGWHIPAKYDRSIRFSDYLTFAIVRDPLDRFISELNYLATQDPTFIEKYRDINQFIKEKLVEGSKDYDCHLIPQSEYLVDAYGDPVQNILRFENLNEDLQKFIDIHKLSIKYSNERENQSKKVYGLKDLTPESITSIKSYYLSDYLFLSNDDNKKFFISQK